MKGILECRCAVAKPYLR